MKIGILTFHWGTNYGGVLQAYALQTFLEDKGFEVYIINYKPATYEKSILKCFKTPRFWLWPRLLHEYIKENRISKFRKEYFNLSILYDSIIELKKNPPIYDVYIAGSDQIWNPSFTTGGEGQFTSSYFLDFGSKKVKRIGYAISFGCEVYPKDALNFAGKFIENFNAISVRENSGIKIVESLGYNNPFVMPDPTLLLTSKRYNQLLNNKVSNNSSKYVFSYFLRGEDKVVKKAKSYIKKSYSVHNPDKFFNPHSIEDWIREIKNSCFVITNSFHGMVFSIIYHKPFIVFPANDKYARSNDRFYTLLQELNLEKRIMDKFDTKELCNLIEERVDWELIDEKISHLRSQAFSFLKKSIKE